MTTLKPTKVQVANVMAEMERLEGQQINIGISNTSISIDFLTDVVQKIDSSITAELVAAILDQQIAEGEVIEVEAGVFRSKIAETTRAIRFVRQRLYSTQDLAQSKELVEAVRAEFRPRTRPDRKQINIAQLIDSGTAKLDDDLKESLRWMIEEGLEWDGAAAFQQRAFTSIYELSETDNAEGQAVVVAGDTGSGKTEGFLLPILARIAQQKRDLKESDIASGVGAVFVYPRIRLALNQLERIVKILKLWELYGGPRLTVGIQNVRVKSKIEYYKSFEDARQTHGKKGSLPPRTVAMELISSCPFSSKGSESPTSVQDKQRDMAGQLVFEDNNQLGIANTGYPRLVSRDPQYWQAQSEQEMTLHQKLPNDAVLDQMLVTKSALQKCGDTPESIPDILIITDKSLSLYLVQPEYQHLWGLWSTDAKRRIAPPRFLVLDEVHLMNGLPGAHLSRLISRFQARVLLAAQQLNLGDRYAIPVGVSATLYDEAGFMAKVLGINPEEAEEKIRVCKPNDSSGTGDELIKTTGRERYIFVRPFESSDPTSPQQRVGNMSVAVQTVMASMHNLMPRDQGESLQYKGLAFFDSINDVNLFEESYNARKRTNLRSGANTERLWSIRTRRSCPLTKKQCQAGNTNQGGSTKFFGQCPAFLAGDCWVFAQIAGWDKQLKVSGANFSGVDVDPQGYHLIPTSPTLEVGYDDDTIQYVYQHMAPANVAAYIQRRGRAGRKADQSPVIVTLLSPYRARDLFYFYRPTYLYNPSFDDIPLNAKNRYVQITHAFLAIFDWLASQTSATTWQDVSNETLREIYSANYTNIKKRLRLNKREMSNWGNKILNQLETQLRLYLESQKPTFAPNVIDEALDLLRTQFFQPWEHRVLDDSSKSYERDNFLSSFKRIAGMLQDDAGESVVEVTYTSATSSPIVQAFFSNAAPPDPSTPLDRGITELLPGNVTYRLRVGNDAYWSPVRPDKESTYLYPDEDAEYSAMRSARGEEFSLARLKDSLMGIPSFLNDLYPGLRYFKPQSLKAELYRGRQDDSLWVYNPQTETAILASTISQPETNQAVRYLDRRGQAFASSVIVPFQPQDTAPGRSVQPPQQLDQVFASINAYLDNDIGYLQLFWSYDSTLNLVKRGSYDSVNAQPKLQRLFYGPHSTPEKPDPRMAAYEIHTQALEFIVSQGFCRSAVINILRNNELRLHFRQRYVAYTLGKAATKVDPAGFSLRYVQLAQLIVSYWLACHVPANPSDPSKWLLTKEDLPLVRDFAEGADGTSGEWSGEQAVGALLGDFFADDPASQERAGRLIQVVNTAIQDGFTDSRAFRWYLESVVLHSLAIVVKNHCALLGGVSSDALVVYVDLPGLDHVSQPDQPRILVLDTVSGGTGAIGQAFENLTRKPKATGNKDRNLWALLQTGLGACPVGDGELLLRRFLLSIDPEDAPSLIKEIRSEPVLGADKLRQAIESAGFVIPDQPTFETVARAIFAGDVYVATSATALDDALDGTTNGAAAQPVMPEDQTLLTPQTALQPPLIVYELIRQEAQLQQDLGYRPRPEIVVAKVLKTIGANTWPHIEALHRAIRRDLEASGQIVRLRRQMTTQLLSLMPRRCEDGCPVCLVNGSNMELGQLAPYLNSRLMLRQVREMLLVDSVPMATNLVQDLIESKAIRLEDQQQLPSQLGPLNGALQINTLSEDGRQITNTIVPAQTLDNSGSRQYLSLLSSTPVDSRGEVIIAGYLDMRKQLDGWTYTHGEPIAMVDPETGKMEQLKPDFQVMVPYSGKKYARIIIEFWGLAGDPTYDARREVKERCYEAENRSLLGLEPDDLFENRFVNKIEEFVKQVVATLGGQPQLTITPLENLGKQS